jgi:oxygen-dependent protoporphyrinogen oxidase
LIESAANAFIASRELERVAQMIGVVLHPILPVAKKRFIYREGQMRRWPLSFMESWPVLRTYGRARFLGNLAKPEAQESLRAWGVLNLGSAGLDYLLEPAMQGVFASAAESLSARAVFESLWPPLAKGSLRGSVAPARGMGGWIRALGNFLKGRGCEIRTGQAIEDPEKFSRRILAVSLRDLKDWQNRQILSHLPESLRETRLASLSSVTLLFKRGQSHPEGFGCLFPRKENFSSLGVLFNHNIFSGRAGQGESETWILNDESSQFSEMSHLALQRYVLSDRAQLFGRSDQPIQVITHQWTDKIPVYNQQLLTFIEDVRRNPPPYLLMGNYLGQLGVSRLLTVAQQNVSKIQGGFFA